MKKGLYNTGALILDSFDYGESDRIITFYTSGFGKLKGIAKGARRSRRRFVGKLDILTEIKLIFFHNEKSDLARVEDAALVDPFSRVKSDVAGFSGGCCMAELVSEMTREGQASPQVYGLLRDFLKLLDSCAGAEAGALTRFFEIKLLALLGFMPHLTGCVVCKTDIREGAGIFFVPDKGGAVCRPCCAAAGAAPGFSMSAGTAMFLSSAARFDMGQLPRLKPGAACLKESEKILDGFIKHQLGRELKTKKFLAKMNAAANIESCIKSY
ncbi:MAG: DNA repair protein RecO [Deltaproteobacteria bacterium]|nr:DNA repair protein RecO [Deltaproteobacteria bacterium]